VRVGWSSVRAAGYSLQPGKPVEVRQRPEMPGGGGLKRPKPKLGCTAIE